MIWWIVIWAVMLIVGGLILTLWLYHRSHDYKIRVRQLTSDKTKVIWDTVAKVKEDKERIKYLKLFNKIDGMDCFPLPPPKAIDYDPKKKKKVLEAYYSPEMGVSYLFDEIDETHKAIGFQPLTTKQRSMLVNQIRKKEERRKQGWSQHIPLIVGSIAIVLIIAILLLFWGEAIKPMHMYADKMAEVTESLNQVAGKLAAIKSDTQIIGGSPP